MLFRSILTFEIIKQGQIQAIRIPFNDNTTNYYDARYIIEYSDLALALAEASRTNAGGANAAPMNVLYMLTDYTGDITIKGDDPSEDSTYSNFVEYAGNKYNNSVKIISAARNDSESVTAIGTNALAKTIYGDVTVASISSEE